MASDTLDMLDQQLADGGLVPSDDTVELTNILVAQATGQGGDVQPVEQPGTQSGTPVPATGDRVEFVPDADNVVRLPATATLETIQVEGDDLIVVQADGTLFVIKGGALDVPTFLIGDVEVPRVAILAVLEENGIDVAFGADGSIAVGDTPPSPPSSGNNFNNGPDGDGGDNEQFLALLGESEFGGETQEVQEILDTPPDRGIDFFGSDNLTVNESDLPNGSTAMPEGARSAIGTLNFQVLDGISQVLINNTLVTAAGQVIAGEYGTLTILTFTPTQITYRYDLSGPTQGDDNVDSFVVRMIDTDQDEGELVINVAIVDDVPSTGENPSIGLDDETLGGNAGGVEDADPDSVNATGTLAHVFGADGGSIAWLDAGAPAGFTYSVSGNVLTVTQGDTVVVTATLDPATGAYEVVLVNPILHAPGADENDQSFTFNYRVTDGDTDFEDGSVTLTVDDDTPILGDAILFPIGPSEGPSAIRVNAVVDEDDLTLTNGITVGNNDLQSGDLQRQPGGEGDSSIVTASLGILWGADSRNSVENGGVGLDGPVAGDRSLVFSAGAMQALLDLGLESRGDAITYSVNDTGTVLTASVGERVVFTVTLSDTGSGSFTFDLNDVIDHPEANTEDNAILTFGFVARDADGDPVTGSFSVAVNDDSPVATEGTVTSSALDDEAHDVDGTGGAFFPNNTPADADGLENPSTASGLANALFRAGADGVRSIAIKAPDFDVIFNDGGFAETEAVQWVSEGSVGTDGTTVWTASSPHHELAARLTIRTDGSYTFELFAPVAHSGGNDGEVNDSLSFGYVVTDGDGDQASGTLVVPVNDDVTVTTGSVTSTTVLDDEAHDLDGSSGSFDPNTGFQLGDATGAVRVAEGAAGSLFRPGADGVKSVAMTSAAFSVIWNDNGFARTEVATWSLTSASGGETVWTASSLHHAEAAVLTIRSDGSYRLEVNAPVVHPEDSLVEEEVGLTFSYTVTDGDGDEATGSLRVNVDDDRPTTSLVVTPAALDDEAHDVDGPSAGGFWPNPGGFGDVSPDRSTAAGGAGALFRTGSDGLGSVTVALPGFAVVFMDGQGFAQTVAASWDAGVVTGAGATTWTATRPDGLGGQITVATLTIRADGSYDFALFAPVAHAIPTPLAGEDSALLNFGYTVRDGDGDTTVGLLTVTVNDDRPTTTGIVNGTMLDDEAHDLDGSSGAFSGKFYPNLTNNTGSDAAGALSVAQGGAGALFRTGSDGLGGIVVGLPSFDVVYMNANGFAQVEDAVWLSTAGVRSFDAVAGVGVTTWEAVREGTTEVVARLQIWNNGAYKLELFAPLAHPTNGTSEENVRLDFTYAHARAAPSTARFRSAADVLRMSACRGRA